MANLKGYRAAILAASVASLAGCSIFRWSGHHKAPEAAPENIDPRLSSGLVPPGETPRPAEFSAPASTGTARPRPEARIPAVTIKDAKETVFYTDLGPDTVDVSEYPTQQKYNYAVYAKVCSRCHTLARSINLPVVSRRYWDFYLLSMRGKNWFAKNPPITKDERKALLDFLDYDSKVRKVLHEKEFEALTEELERRFEPMFQERVRRLQQAGRPDEYLP